MNANNELIHLVISNMDAVSQSYELLMEIDNSFKKTIDNFMRRKISEKFPDWERECSYFENYDLSFWPKSWHIKNNNREGYAYYKIDTDNRGNEYLCDLTLFAGHLEGKAFFKFEVDRDIYNLKRKEWTAKKENFYNINELELKKASFQFEDGQIVRPFRLNDEILADSSSNFDFEDDAFQPLADALQDIKSVHHLFDAFVNELAGREK